MAARAQMEIAPQLLARYYEAARPSRGTYGWLAGFSSANTEVWGGLATLRARSRELVRNNPHARKAVAALVNNSVGAGIVARAKTGDRVLDKRVNALWRQWVKTCDAEGHYDFYGLQKLAVRAFFESGEAVLRYLPRRLADGPVVPLQLQVLEGDYLDHTKNARLPDGRIVQGIELDAKGVRRRYWLYDEHPGEMPLVRGRTLQSAPVPASSLLHLYEKERPGQQRGVAWLYAAMVKLREIETYEEAELIRKRLEACLAAIVLNPEGIADPGTGDVQVTPGITDMAGNKVEAIEPGMFYYARGGSDIKFTQPSAVPGYADYKRSQLHSVAAGALVTYELLTGDLSHVNYSSIRAGLVEFRRLMAELQWLTLIPVLCDPVWRAFIDFAVAAGRLPADTPDGVAWSPPAFEAVDPVKDYMADQIAVRSGFMTLPEAMASRGFDPEDMLEEQAELNKLVDSLGLVFDSDPRKTARAGTAQPGGGSVSAGGEGDSSERGYLRDVQATKDQ